MLKRYETIIVPIWGTKHIPFIVKHLKEKIRNCTKHKTVYSVGNLIMKLLCD